MTLNDAEPFVVSFRNLKPLSYLNDFHYFLAAQCRVKERKILYQKRTNQDTS